MSNKLVDTLFVIGKELDRLKVAAGGSPLINPGLLQDIFPDTSFSLLRFWETAYNLSSDGTTEARRKRILTAIKKQGGLTKLYIERLCNTLGGSIGPYRYLFNIDQTAPPNANSIKWNAGITEIYVDNTSLDDEELRSLLLERNAGDKLFVFNAVDGDNYQETLINSVVDQGTYTQFNVTLVGANGPSLTNNQNICLVIGKADSYEVKLTEGSGGTGFIIHTFGPSTIPTGPATPLPGILLDIGSLGNPFTITVHVYNSPGMSEPELERLVKEIKWAAIEEFFIYH
jgi:hypothetical protein